MANRRSNKNTRVYRAGDGKARPAGHGAPKIYRNNGSKKPNTALVIGIAFAILLVVFLLWFFLRDAGQEPESTSWASVLTAPPQSAPAEEPESEPEPEPEPEPEAAAPVDLGFTDAEIERLDTLLAEWAEAVTAPVDEDGSENEGHDLSADGAGLDGDDVENDPFFTPENYGHTVAVYFCDLDSGLSYIYNGESSFEIASLNKAPYAMYLYTLADAGALDLNETVHVTEAMLAASAENSGVLKDDESLPRDITIEELLATMLRYSDTGALRILLTQYPAAGYAEWAARAFPGVDAANLRSVTNGRVTAGDAGAYMQGIYAYMESGAEHAARLKEHLANTRNHMITSAYTVVRKYGWDTYSYHDMAVVYSGHPYVLAVLTDKSYGTWAETAKFGEIAATFEEIMAEKWAATSAA